MHIGYPLANKPYAICFVTVMLWWVSLPGYVCLCLSICGSLCLSARIYPELHARSLPFFVHDACVCGSVLLRYVYDRPHRLSSWRGFLLHWKCIIGREGKGGWECTARAKYAIYDCLVVSALKALRIQSVKFARNASQLPSNIWWELWEQSFNVSWTQTAVITNWCWLHVYQ